MKKVLLLICLCFSLQIVFSQDNSEKKYQLNKLDSAQIHTTKEFAYKLESIGKGIIVSELQSRKIEFTIIKNFDEVHYVDRIIGDNTMERIVKKDTSYREVIMNEKPIKHNNKNSFTEDPIIFERENGLWEVSKLASYNYTQKEEIYSQLKTLNKNNGNRIQDFIYPDYMRIGDTFEITSENINNFFDIPEIKAATGTFTLKNVIIEDNDTVAVFAVDFTVEGLAEGDQVDIKFKGTIKRSISKFYDKEMDVIGEIVMSTKKIGAYSKMPCTFFSIRKLY